jgi:hypothetical protein
VEDVRQPPVRVDARLFRRSERLGCLADKTQRKSVVAHGDNGSRRR